MPNSEQTSVETGERYAKSQMTGNYYRVTKWIDHGDGKIQAKEKQKVERSEVPQDSLEAIKADTPTFDSFVYCPGCGDTVPKACSECERCGEAIPDE